MNREQDLIAENRDLNLQCWRGGDVSGPRSGRQSRCTAPHLSVASPWNSCAQGCALRPSAGVAQPVSLLLL